MSFEEWCANVDGDLGVNDDTLRCELDVPGFGEEWVSFDGDTMKGQLERWNGDIIHFQAQNIENIDVSGEFLDVYGSKGPRELRIKPERL